MYSIQALHWAFCWRKLNMNTTARLRCVEQHKFGKFFLTRPYSMYILSTLDWLDGRIKLIGISLQPAFLYYSKGLQGKTSSQRAIISHNSQLGVCRWSKNFCSWHLLAQHQPSTWQQGMAVQRLRPSPDHRPGLFGSQAMKRCLSQM